MSDIQTCPRRLREMGPWEHAEGIDEWRDSPRRDGEATPYCSFCGSLHPGKFLELIAQGWSVGPTDKNYKAYLHPVREDVPPPGRPGDPLPQTAPQIQSKFYYQHLSPTQQRQFIDLYNQNIMRISTPGHFYVLPFFMCITPREENQEG